MVFINETDIMGQIIRYSLNLTGSIFMTVLVIFIIILTLALLFRIPIEITIPILLPLFLVSMAYSTEFLAIGGIMLIYLAILFVKFFIIK